MANLISQVTPVGQTKDYGLRASAVQYGTCSTATGTAAKTVTCTSFTSNYLVEGSIVAVKFSATNGAAPSSLTLNVNSTGAKPIKFINNGALSDLPSAGYIKENLIYLFYYDGTNWVTLLNYDTNDTSSLEVINSNPTLAWGTQSIVGSIDGTELTVTMPAVPVTSIKGNAENTYRTGQVNLTPANLGISATGTSVTVGNTTFNKYTHPTTSGNKHIPSGGSSGQFLGWDSDGTAKWVNNPNSDTNYYHKTGSWSGLTYTAGKVGSPDDLAFTIPTGTSATTVAVGNHTHTTSLTSGGTATVNLAANTTYTLTAGGTSVIFKTPADGNTDTKVNVVARGTTKSYLMADTTSPTSTAGAHTAVAETGIYMTTTAGELNATQYKVNEAVTLQYNATTKSLDFIFA